MTLSTANNYEGYHPFFDGDGDPYGSLEVYWWEPTNLLEEETGEPGWYWWPCHPGCLPDSNGTGPFASSQEALKDAQQV